MDRHADTAALLLSARRDPSQKLNSFPNILAPKDEHAAYAVQRRVMEGLGESIGGWKVGAAGPTAACTCAPMPASGIHPGPARAPNSSLALRGIEAEISFRLGADLPLRDEPYGRAEVIAAIAYCLPAIEILDSRFTDPAVVDKLSLLADFNTHGGFVYGAPAADWQGIDFSP